MQNLLVYEKKLSETLNIPRALSIIAQNYIFVFYLNSFFVAQSRKKHTGMLMFFKAKHKFFPLKHVTEAFVAFHHVTT